ncbi:MAG: type I DNA topoisomerase [Candidatus Babeliales bacterium]
MKKLLIVESPSKIKTITKFLDKDFTIMSTVGHIKDLPPKKLGITIEPDKHISIEYVVIENKDKVIADICKKAASMDTIYLAPDPDREGEIIAEHIAEEIRKVAKKKSVVHRIMFNEITKNAILNAIQHPLTINDKMVAAQQARRILDRWLGYEVSPILWKKVAPGLSAGRVQSVALLLICQREQAIRAFQKTEYWSITVQCSQHNAPFEATLANIEGKKAVIPDEKTAQAITNGIKKTAFFMTDIKNTQRQKKAYPPFMTSTLQQTAFNRLGFSVKKTMQLAQKLYEGLPLDQQDTPVALITYMRTDSLRVADSALDAVRSYIKKSFGDTYLPTKGIIYSTKDAAQDAHEAIRPIDTSITPEKASAYLPKDLGLLYGLIWKRFVSSQMKAATYAQRKLTISGGSYTLTTVGSTLLFDGFLKIYEQTDEKEENQTNHLPATLKKNEPVAITKVNPKQHFTQPPPRYTEASLVKELESENVGRPSTYATIISTLVSRAYTIIEKKRFIPTELGMTTNNLLVENLPDIINVKFTAKMEESLDKIAQGKLARDTLLLSFYKTFQKDLAAFKKKYGSKQKIATPTDLLCPQCNDGSTKLVIRFGRAGEFLGCEQYPDCSFTSNFERTEEGVIQLVAPQKVKLIDATCPQCHKPLKEIQGKFGPFIACSGYPTCKYIQQKKASFSCPLCKKGDVVQKRWRKGLMWGCSTYPKCTFSVFGDIEETPCSACKAPFLLKKYTKNGTVVLTCANKSCPSHGKVKTVTKRKKTIHKKAHSNKEASENKS